MKCPTCDSDRVDCCLVGHAEQYNCLDCGTGWSITMDVEQKAVVETVAETPEVTPDGDSNLAG